jgi:hypothetical protein
VIQHGLGQLSEPARLSTAAGSTAGDDTEEQS